MALTALEQLVELLPSIKHQILFADANHFLPPQHHRDVRRIVSGLDTAVSQIDAAGSLLRQLRSTAVISRRNHLKLISSPLGLPNETLSNIFVLALPSLVLSDPTDVKPYQLYQRLRMALNLADVCKRWREVALATPWLWNLIRIDWPAHHDPDRSRELVARSRPLPVYVCVYVNRWAPSFRPACEQGLLAPFRESCRIVDVVAYGADSDQTLDMGSLLSTLGDWPHLEQLVLPKSCVYLTTAPLFVNNIRRLDVHLTGGDDCRMFFRLRWAHLESLTLFLGSQAQVDLSSLPYNFPRLEELFLETKSVKFFPPPAAPVSHAGLRLLGICTLGGFYPRATDSDGSETMFLEHVTLPRLTTLMIPVRFRHDVHIIARFLERSACRLATSTMLATSKQEPDSDRESEDGYESEDGHRHELLETSLIKKLILGVSVSKNRRLYGLPEYRACRKRWHAKYTANTQLFLARSL
ncbi:hypothetical protein CONPUDRAFT_152603 [Coniophora puteana RWD-64-598 SS2]|uniref:Uncharacterized protein n=1 Tax=Coniophora puteana (strain RWD-64-598) TaxID=741705 RepID=A0A5M3MSP8_CONPW|nr:uncharacterized protein CONPUDRAFT_152603 [Coniophora puteana RWD-64-598 SS2]EIW81685.1 hypothetical protein CONPUDRAFT_152603 [Coniophora puteana RWD-64-598 SS2]